MSRNPETLLDIAKFAQRAIEFAQETDSRGLAEHLLVQSTILHQLLVLGKAVKRLSDSFRNQHPAIPWSIIADMRDNLTHDYLDVDLNLTWDPIERDLPALFQYVEPLFPKEE